MTAARSPRRASARRDAARRRPKAPTGQQAPGPSPVAGSSHEATPWEEVIDAVGRARHPLAAELVLCEAFGVVAAAAGDEADPDAALRLFLEAAAEHATRAPTPQSLATLRVMSVLGPPEVQAVARVGAARLAADGVTDRPWATRLGRPAVLRSWRYGDIDGEQTSLGILFVDRGREHVLMVLIDHVLGGGVKDAWLAEGRRARGMRDEVAADSSLNPYAVFEDLDVAGAAEHLSEALEHPACPVHDDQVGDVARYLPLVRSRAEHLRELAGSLPPP